MTRFMTARRRLACLAAIATCAAAAAGAASAQAGPRTWPDRAIRRDIPMTDAIRAAHAAGTRDSSGRPGPRYWQLRTDYVIQARLDVPAQRLSGRETITLHNASPDSLTQLALRLDANHFIGSNPRALPWVPAQLTDGMVVTAIRINGRPVRLDAPPPARGSAPPEPVAVNLKATLARVVLATAIQPRTSATIDIEWNHALPGGPGSGHRMTQRWADSLFQPTQWFPRIAVYDDLRGWDPESYLGPSEFYNNFGRFDVKLDVPAGWLVSGTGILQNPEQVLTAAARARLTHVLESDSTITIVGPDEVGPGQATAAGDRLVWHMVADSVNDFAWATARKFVWRATRATIPGRGAVPVHMFYLPGRAPLFANAGPVTRHALEFYSRLWFPYQFPQLTLQDGPSAGMEYPMVINSNVGAADHETGHQWWPMVVSNNETWYGWMDEGFNQYMNILSAADNAKTAPNLDRLGQQYGLTSGSEAEPPMMWNANFAGPSYGFTTYGKTPLMLSMLGGIVGDTAVQRAHREWGIAWMYRHPSPWDYMFFMNKALGRDLGWFWYAWLFTTERVDGSISGLRTQGASTIVTVRQDGQMPSPVVLRVRFAPTGPRITPMKESVWLDSVTAVVTFPVDVWFGGKRTFDAVLRFGKRPIEQVLFDPGCRFPDRDPADNVWPRTAAPAPGARPSLCSR
ncbi:MAG: M1 family metallopeptidase [Gemmatimonadaceae bacterium]|nr:M1 family metallopeptidase [Gemmatimonadaceae bacterium]